MILLNSTSHLQELLEEERATGKTIGYVPTMGALHAGHISLVKRCKQDHELCVASVFVNPTQFDNEQDLAKYPRTPDKDCVKLMQGGCNIAFLPAEIEIYPFIDTRIFDLGRVSEVMEGAYRPGHFNGVAQVLTKMFPFITPDSMYLGEKDFQQIAVVRELARQQEWQVNIVACPIVREPDGLAMSSRNIRMTPEERKTAPAIARTLNESLTMMSEKTVDEVKQWVTDTLNAMPHLCVEYYEIVDERTLENISEWSDADDIRGCIAVYCGKTRLIDNIKYR